MARKILLADDSVTAQNMGRKILADAGYEVITVNNGSAALKRIAELKPDLIVLDVYMPGYSGLEVCQRLKEAGETARIPVLLTVGKLEPFKPEEARRARADGFIVKPFEASELLSALAKLEDKIVPRTETSKPGRFARSIAAIEEGRYDKTMAADEDSGWKNRIAFPSKKAKSAEQENGDDSAIYNAVNKDLRTVVDHSPPRASQQTPAQETSQEISQEMKTGDARVDLGALAPQGLPKDVTPEEIAALAAAAAQVQGIAASKSAEVKSETKTDAQLASEESINATVSAVSARAEASTDENLPEKAGAKLEAKSEGKIEGKIESAPTPGDVSKSVDTPVPSSASDDRGLADSALAAVADAQPDNGNGQHGRAGASDEPVTMAAAAGNGSTGSASRWTAVAVAVAPEEAALSLEHEMQKTYAAFAAAEANHQELSVIRQEPQATPVPAVQETKLSEAASSAVPASESATLNAATPIARISEPTATSSATAVPEAARTLETVATVATEAISAAIRELETVAASYLEQAPPQSSSESAPVQAIDAPLHSSTYRSSYPSTQPGSEEPRSLAGEARAVENVPSAQESSTKQDDGRQEADRQPVRNNEDPLPISAIAERQSEERQARADNHDEHSGARDSEIAAPATKNDVSADETSADQPIAKPAISDAAKTAAPTDSTHGGFEEMGKKESEIAATTAAAWASWRRIRESGDSKGSAANAAETSEKESYVPGAGDAAMAVAAGAEHNPEEVPAASGSDPDAIANIVDSVLADLRPKIVEEISRKLGRKK